MTTDEKFKLITRNLEETLTEEELKTLLESGTPLKHYIGFEISGKVHLGQGLAAMQKVKELHNAGCETTIFLADWHTWLNKKLDGTLETATRMAREFFEEALKAAYLCVGGNPSDLKFILGSELYDKTYWPKVIQVAKATTISRMMRSTDIMGRMAGESSDTASLFYPSMQAADIFQMGINIAHAGTDQRNVHVVAREAAKDLGTTKPIALHHHLIMGLKPLGENNDLILQQAKDKLSSKSKPGQITNIGGLSYEEKVALIAELKMSKSRPDTAVFITDSPDDIKRKVNNAYCPEGQVDLNPILDWTKHLVFYPLGADLGHPPGVQIKRKEEHGGDITYISYAELEKDYADKKLHPQDLKIAVAEWLIKKLEPAREYFKDPKRKQALEEITALTSKS
ncbi:MAG: tyrosine--tRNA ligase [Candidatus Daviesbacteria bacterium]|nr:MAG: tyrosine--tRNA ligase [Candidatus Daviesbacteria bacterium]